MARNTLSRTLHDVGLSAWFGGTLANAVALNAAAGEAGSDAATGRVANAGWDRWTPVNAAAIGVHLVGSVGQLRANKQRVAAQQGVAGMSALKTLVTAAALGATAYSRVLGQKVSAAENPPSKRGTKPSRRTKAAYGPPVAICVMASSRRSRRSRVSSIASNSASKASCAPRAGNCCPRSHVSCAAVQACPPE